MCLGKEILKVINKIKVHSACLFKGDIKFIGSSMDFDSSQEAKLLFDFLSENLPSVTFVKLIKYFKEQSGVRCPACEGEGKLILAQYKEKPDSKPKLIMTCPECKGKGKVIE